MNRRSFLRVGILGATAAALAPLIGALPTDTPAVADPAEGFASGGEWIPQAKAPLVGEQVCEFSLWHGSPALQVGDVVTIKGEQYIVERLGYSIECVQVRCRSSGRAPVYELAASDLAEIDPRYSVDRAARSKLRRQVLDHVASPVYRNHNAFNAVLGRRNANDSMGLAAG